MVKQAIVKQLAATPASKVPSRPATRSSQSHLPPSDPTLVEEVQDSDSGEPAVVPKSGPVKQTVAGPRQADEAVNGKGPVKQTVCPDLVKQARLSTAKGPSSRRWPVLVKQTRLSATKGPSSRRRPNLVKQTRLSMAKGPSSRRRPNLVKQMRLSTAKGPSSRRRPNLVKQTRLSAARGASLLSQRRVRLLQRPLSQTIENAKNPAAASAGRASSPPARTKSFTLHAQKH